MLRLRPDDFFAVERFDVERLLAERFDVGRLLVERFEVARLLVARFAVDLRPVDFFAVERFDVARFDVARFDVARFAVDFRVDDFFAPPRLRAGTFAPFSRASSRPIAIACSRLLTVPPRPPRPRFSVPLLRRRIALPTLLLAAAPYFRPPDFLPDEAPPLRALDFLPAFALDFVVAIAASVVCVGRACIPAHRGVCNHDAATDAPASMRWPSALGSRLGAFHWEPRIYTDLHGSIGYNPELLSPDQ